MMRAGDDAPVTTATTSCKLCAPVAELALAIGPDHNLYGVVMAATHGGRTFVNDTA